MKIIAEFCQNHNGDFEILKRMIHAAAEGGATHGKIQTIFAEDLSFRDPFEQGEVDQNQQVTVIKRPYQPEYDRLKGLELTYQQHLEFISICHQAGLIPLTTAFNRDRVPELAQMGWKSIKIASYDCGALPLIQDVAQHFEELIISTGATFDEEIQQTAAYLNRIQKTFSFLHCVTIYPTPLSEMNLARMAYLRKFTPEVGLSDHSLVSRDGVKAAIAAIYLGATIIERHFTVLAPEDTRDGKVSISKAHIQELVAFSKLSKGQQQAYIETKLPEFASMIGQESRALSHEELLNRAYYRGRFCNKRSGQQVFNWEG